MYFLMLNYLRGKRGVIFFFIIFLDIIGQKYLSYFASSSQKNILQKLPYWYVKYIYEDYCRACKKQLGTSFYQIIIVAAF